MSVPSLLSFKSQNRSAASLTNLSPTSPRRISTSRSPTNVFKTVALPRLNSPIFNRSPTSMNISPEAEYFPKKAKGIMKGNFFETNKYGSESNREKSYYTREVKFDFMLDPPKNAFQKIKEESTDRLATVRKYIKGIDELKQGNKFYSSPLSEKYMQMLDVVENTFSTLNIKVKEIKSVVKDSAITIYPVEVSQELVNFYQVLMQEVCEFPYSFLAKLKIFMITVCGSVELQNQGYMKIFKQKINNGLFLVQHLQTREAIRSHWYRIVIYHFVKVEPEFYPKWKEIFGSGNYKKGDMEELIMILKYVMKHDTPNKANKGSKYNIIHVEAKMAFLKEELAKFDPMVLHEEWSTLKKKEEAV